MDVKQLSPEEVVAVILAGGLGTRVRHLLPDLPKPMAPFEGRPFLEWVVRYLSRMGLCRMVISTGYQADIVAHHFDRQPVKGAVVRCVAESQPLGTAGGFLNAIRGVNENPAAWLVLNGDSLALANLAPLFARLADASVAGAILGVRMEDASRYGTVTCDSEGWLTGFQEKRPGAGIINAGVYLLRASAVAEFPKQIPLSFEREVFPILSAGRKRLKVYVTEAPFLDIGTPETLPQAAEFLIQHQQAFSNL
jgi:D-glycero-alpha-D-manno-heptose 1-phosphate guanylyltransferase